MTTSIGIDKKDRFKTRGIYKNNHILNLITMKKKYFAGLALLCMAALGTPATAQEMSPTATDEVYDFSGFTDTGMLNLFYDCLQDGRKYPTMEEFEAAGIQASDLAFVRSHVRKAELLGFEDRLNQDITYAERDLWLNIPMGVGKGLGGYPNSVFSSDVFSMWNYTNLFGSWNHGIFQAPGCWVDAAHKNGTDIYSGIKFFESWTAGGDKSWKALIQQKNADGTYKYVKPIINCLMFFGADGINYNWEDNGWSNTEMTEFHKALYQEAAAQGFTNFHCGIYTSNSVLTPVNKDKLFGTTETGRTFELMLNYSGGDFTGSSSMATSVNTAKSAMGTTDGLYTGVWIVNMNRSWSNLSNNPEINVCLWGEHAQSRFMSYNQGNGGYEFQSNYQAMLERAFSGGHRNPANRPTVTNTGINWEPDALGNPPLYMFSGLAEWIPERSAIKGNLPFATHFILGNGDRYYYKGKKTAGPWYNIGAQDYVPTYRWLVYDANTTTVSTKIQPAFYHKDAYMAGSCLQLKGEATSDGTDIVLYKTALRAQNAAKAKVAVKNLKGAQPTNLYVIIKTEGSDAWKEYAVGSTTGSTWEEMSFDLAGIAAGSLIERIGLRVKGSEANYELLVGKLEISDGTTITPAPAKDLVVEVKEETKSTMSVKAHWAVEAEAQSRADWGLLYNDEANIDHFEMFYKNGENGRVSEIARTTSWANYVGNIQFESADDEPYIGVRSVSTDLKTYSPIVWVKVPRAAQNALPEYEDMGAYGLAEIDPSCDGYDGAIVNRYVASVTTTGAEQNLNYTANAPVADGTNYANALDHVLKVKQGQQVTINIKAANAANNGISDGLQYCFFGGWIDFNGSGDYDHPFGTTQLNKEQFPGDAVDPLGEMVFKVGKVRAATPEIEGDGVERTFTIPEDAVTGNSRLRIVFCDAWFTGAFGPSGYNNKGFAIDFAVEIEGTNPERQPDPDTRDQGIADEPEGLGGDVSGIEDVVAGETSQAVVEGNTLNFANVEKAWIYGTDGKFVEFLSNNPRSASLAGYPAGAYIVKMRYKNVIRTQKILVK